MVGGLQVYSPPPYSPPLYRPGAAEKSPERIRNTSFSVRPDETRNYVQCDPKQVLPYLAGHLSAHHATTRFVYIGTNPRTLEQLGGWLERMGFARPVTYLIDSCRRPRARLATTRHPLSREEAADDVHARTLIDAHDALIFDFALIRPRARRTITRVGEWPRELRFALGAVARHLRSCAEQCHAVSRGARSNSPSVRASEHQRKRVRTVCLAVPAPHDTPHRTEVRTGRARVGQERLYPSERWKRTEQVMRSAFGYDIRETVVPRISLGQSIDLTRSGWATPARTVIGDCRLTSLISAGTWTDGKTADILLNSIRRSRRIFWRTCAFLRLWSRRRGTLSASTCCSRESGGTMDSPNTLPSSDPPAAAPSSPLSGGSIPRLTFEVENPQPV